MIITTNLGFADWTQLFGDLTLTAALLDRLTHKAHIVMCDWDGHRLKEKRKAEILLGLATKTKELKPEEDGENETE